MRNAATPSIRTVGPGRDFAERAAVHRLDLEVNRGEVQGLLGPSGSGKSTTVRMLTTMLHPSPGTAQVTGADITRDPGAVRRHTGVVLQGTVLDSLISARAPLGLQGRLQSLTARQARARRTELLTAFNAEEFPGTSVGKLSGGRRRRIDLAVTLVQRPDTLFLDEPTTALDPASRRGLGDGIRALSANHGTTALLRTPRSEDAYQLCDRVGILRAGRPPRPQGGTWRPCPDPVLLRRLRRRPGPGAARRQGRASTSPRPPRTRPVSDSPAPAPTARRCCPWPPPACAPNP